MRKITFATRLRWPRMNRRLAVALVAAMVLAAGCRREPRGGTVVTGWPNEPGGVNQLILPASQPTSEMLFRIFLHLVEEQPDFDRHPPTFKPELARSYDWSTDPKTLTFHLRD